MVRLIIQIMFFQLSLHPVETIGLNWIHIAVDLNGFGLELG